MKFSYCASLLLCALAFATASSTASGSNFIKNPGNANNNFRMLRNNQNRGNTRGNRNRAGPGNRNRGRNNRNRNNGNTNGCITNAEVRTAVDAWGQALVDIGAAYRENGCLAAVETASGVLETAYAYGSDQKGTVNFKPTLTTSPNTFRPTFHGALSYFVGEQCMVEAGLDGRVRGDDGFALNREGKGFRSPDTSHAAFTVQTGGAFCHVAMVQFTFRAAAFNGDLTAGTGVDKSFVYTRGPGGGLQIALHHSSEKVVA